eukprot:1138272-Pelagomonas_calceolata.AAC.4
MSNILCPRRRLHEGRKLWVFLQLKLAGIRSRRAVVAGMAANTGLLYSAQKQSLIVHRHRGPESLQLSSNYR